MNRVIDLTIADGVAKIRLNRPRKRNAINQFMLEQLAHAVSEIERSEARVALLAAEGPTFCAGGDINEWADQSPEVFSRRWVRDGHETLDRLTRLRQPLIALLEGNVWGGGLELIACADFRLAEEHVMFGQPETGLGIIPGWSGTQRAVRRFGVQAVRRMALFGERLNACQAHSLGIVDRVVSQGQGANVAHDMIRNTANRAPRASELVKMMINAAEGEARESAIEALAGAIAAASSDLEEGLAARREQRMPVFPPSTT